MLTKFTAVVDGSSPLLMLASDGNIPNHYETPVRRIKVVSISVLFLPLKLTGYHSNDPWVTAKRM